MDFFFKPNGIALIGATTNPLKGANAILTNLITGFKGAIYPVNPRYAEIQGLKCYPTVAAVPDPVDLAIVFIPARAVVEAVKACAARGIRGVMVESAGFAEAGEAGTALQAELASVARETGIRVWGPNCMGLVDAVNRHVFSFVASYIWEEGLLPGTVSLVVQSGMLSAGFLIDTMSHGVMGISKACSIGNKADVNECDVLAYLIDDPETAAIGLYLESIPDGGRFLDLCRKSRKPIVVLKGGKSAKGAAAAMSHTASLAGDGRVVSGALAQTGVVEATDFKQMMDLCRTLAQFPERPERKTGRAAILTYSGGAGIVTSDFFDALGLEVAELSPEALAEIRTVFPPWMPVSNPVDMWPAIEQHGPIKVWGTAFRAVCADPGVDAVLMHVFLGNPKLQPDVAALAALARQSGKPLFCWLLGRREAADAFQREAQASGLLVYRELYRAVECMAAVFADRGAGDPASGNDALPEQRIVLPPEPEQILNTATGALDAYAARQVLKAVGIPVAPEATADSAARATAIAAEFGYPVVMKGLMPGTVHKTEAGLVKLHLQSPDMVADAYSEMTLRMGGQGQVLVQKEISGEFEMIAGFFRDPQFGPCVMCGIGGIFTEILADTAFAVAPLTHSDALKLTARLKSQKLLNGFRGQPALARDALAGILVALSLLGRDYPAVREIDINPLIIRDGMPVAVDAALICS